MSSAACRFGTSNRGVSQLIGLGDGGERLDPGEPPVTKLETGEGDVAKQAIGEDGTGEAMLILGDVEGESIMANVRASDRTLGIFSIFFNSLDSIFCASERFKSSIIPRMSAERRSVAARDELLST